MNSVLEAHRQAFDADPENTRGFEAVEEHCFLEGAWDHLVRAYQHRLEAPSLQEPSKPRAQVLFRLAQVLEERCLNVDQAVQHYEEINRIDPEFRPAFRQLRGIYAARFEWNRVLEIAETESKLPMKAFERAAFLAEMGEIWLERFSDREHALGCFERALEEAPDLQAALRGLARVLEQLDRFEEAATSWERLSTQVRGTERAAALVSLAKLLAGPLGQEERAAELYRRALGDNPRNEAAVEALVEHARGREQWPLLADLQERRFDLAAGARRRTEIAVEAAWLQLEKLDSPQLARMWLDRARDLSPDQIEVHSTLVELERRAGNGDALLAALDRVIELSGGDPPASALLEAARLHSDQADDERALALLQRAQQSDPSDTAVLQTLSETLARLGRGAERIEILERLCILAGDDAGKCSRALIELGRVHEEELDDPRAAIDAYGRACQADPETKGAASSLERLYRKIEDWHQLRVFYEQARESGPAEERPYYHSALGEILFAQLGESAEASRAFETALELDPRNASALQGLQQIASESGDDGAMLTAYEREAAVTSDGERMGFLVSELVRLLQARQRNDEALGWVERLLETCPEDRVALEAAAELQESLGLEEELISTCERLEPLLEGPDQAAARRRIGKLHAVLGREENAIRWQESALESDPDDIEALRALRTLYEERRQIDDLVRAQRRLCELVPPAERAVCLSDLALLLEEQVGDIEGAIVVLWQLVQLPDRSEDSEERLEALLERASRYEELAQRLLERRRDLPDDGEAAQRIELKHARLLFDRLAQIEEAAELYRAVLDRDPGCSEAADGLEQTLRAGNDPTALTEFLAERAQRETDPLRRAQREFECAVLREEAVGDVNRARAAYLALVDGCPDRSIASDAAARLENLLERSEDWQGLRARLEARLGQGRPEDDLPLRERLAGLCRNRLEDRSGCIEHLEAMGRIAPEQSEVWRKLATVYGEDGRNEDLLRVLKAELSGELEPDRELLVRARVARLYTADSPNQARDHYERIIELDPSHSEAAEFLIDRYEGLGRSEDVLRMLELRLQASVQTDSETGRDAELAESSRTSLRLRIAKLRADTLDDLDGAIEVLEPALGETGAIATVAEPLADLYQRGERNAALADLCRRASRSSEEASERASWMLRLGAALRELGGEEHLDQAIEAFRNALSVRPDDAEARAAMLELVREKGQSEALARLLQEEIERGGQADSAAVRMELAELLGGPLDRPEDALEFLKPVLGAEDEPPQAFERAAELAERLARHDDLLVLVEKRLTRRISDGERASLLERCADLLAGPLSRPEDAASMYREALSFDPTRPNTRRSLRAVLENLARWPAVLDCMYLEARDASEEERSGLLEQAIELAQRHLSLDAALPWLERLRAERPDDAVVVARIADVHRQAGRPEALLRTLEDELSIGANPARQCEIQLERARVLEAQLLSPGRAIAAVEAAREVAPDDGEVLVELDRLYGLTGHLRERVGVLEARIKGFDGSEPWEKISLHRSAAALYADPLAEPDRAIPHLLRAVELSNRDSDERLTLLRELGDSLRDAGFLDAWARAAEQELRSLPAGDPHCTGRRIALHFALATTYQSSLALPAAALRHLLALMRLSETPSGALDAEQLERLEQSLLSRLRADRNHVELEKMLLARLSRREQHDLGAEDAGEWIELARLREEGLHAPAAAATAYRKALELHPTSQPAIRGLRRASDLLGDWREVARSLELELEGCPDASPHERSALLRRLGQVCWRRLDCLERAEHAYGAALEVQPDDLESLRAFQQLAEAREDWAAVLDLYEREIGVIGVAQPERRQEVWLRVGKLAREHAEDSTRALRAYEEAASIGTLPPERLLEWAELYRAMDDQERYGEVFASWCDHPAAPVEASDHLALAEVLEGLGRYDAALARARQALAANSENGGAWDVVARLYEARGEALDASRALERSAEHQPALQATTRLVRAATLIEREDSERAADLLRRASACDPGAAVPQAHLARVSAGLEAWEEAERAAGHALDLAGAGSLIDDDLHLDTTLVGGRAARALEKFEAAARFLGTACELDPTHPAAFEALGEVLFELGDLEGARRALEARFALPAESDRRPLHLSIVATALEREGEHDAALARYREALAADPELQEAHGGIARIHEAAGRIEQALEAIEDWAVSQTQARGRAECLVRAAELEVKHARLESAENYLRDAVGADPTLGPAWLLLTELLWDAGRTHDALVAASEALPQLAEPEIQARLSLVRGRALEAQGDRIEAASAFAAAAKGDPRSIEAVLSEARLRRSLSDWQLAAEALGDFLEHHPEPDSPGLAQLLYERGRLMAGPLENVEEAVRCYEHALELQPELSQAREPLAGLLSLIPERRRDAVEHHRLLLAADPTQRVPLRGLLRIAREQQVSSAISYGLAVMRALGIASPEERGEAVATLPLQVGAAPQMQEELWEQVRTIALETSRELGEALGRPEDATSVDAGSASDFLDALRRAEGRLSADSLLSLSTEDLGNALHTLAALALRPDGARWEAPEAAALERTVGRWTRRKVRRALEGADLDAIETIDFEAWRAEIRVLAAASALDETGGDLRDALICLTAKDHGSEEPEYAEAADLTPLVANSPTAMGLLGRVVATWCALLEGQL
ncbi:MAG: tetratricopeptide repeat protein [Myxococcota bacterium]